MTGPGPPATSSLPSSRHPQRRRRLVGVSTKMYFSYAQTLTYARALQHHLALVSAAAHDSGAPDPFAETDVFLLPDHLSLAAVAVILGNPTSPTPASASPTNPSNSLPISTSLHASVSPSSPTPPPRILYGAQNCASSPSGPFTGEVSPAVLSTLGCSLVELGHAERRRLFGETDASTAAKAAAAAQHGLAPLVCIGEVERGEGEDAVAVAVAQCRVQVEAVLNAVGAGKGEEGLGIVFAYEPVWAIGADEPADAGYVMGVVDGIRRVVEERGRGAEVRILYGGSAKLGLMRQIGRAVDGLFLGRFAHDPEMAARIFAEVAEA